VNMSPMERLSVLACVTGLAMLAIFFAAIWLGAPQPEWLPMAIAAIAGFEMFMVLDTLRKRRTGGNSNG
jgi:predicted PurR-regulated permease PerM